MPNYCSNNLTVRGDAATLQKLDAEYLSPFSFGKVIPMPDELSKTDAPVRDEELAASMTEKYGAPDWYAWAVANWGTKWDIVDNSGFGYNEKTVSGENEISISFDTAWSPPIPVVRELSWLFPSLEFSLKYFEPGVGFAGDFTAHNGAENDGCYEDSDSEEYREIAEFFGWEDEEMIEEPA